MKKLLILTLSTVALIGANTMASDKGKSEEHKMQGQEQEQPSTTPFQVVKRTIIIERDPKTGKLRERLVFGTGTVQQDPAPEKKEKKDKKKKKKK